MKKYYELLKIELRITFLSRLQYKVGMISDFIMIVGVFLIAFFFNEGSPLKIYYDISSNDGNILFFIGFLFCSFLLSTWIFYINSFFGSKQKVF